MTTFSTRLRALRLAGGWTQQMLADRVGVRQVTISQWELGKNQPQLKPLVKLAEALHVGLDYLTGRV